MSQPDMPGSVLSRRVPAATSSLSSEVQRRDRDLVAA